MPAGANVSLQRPFSSGFSESQNGGSGAGSQSVDSRTGAVKRKPTVLGPVLKEAVVHMDRESTHMTLRSSGLYKLSFKKEPLQTNKKHHTPKFNQTLSLYSTANFVMVPIGMA